MKRKTYTVTYLSDEPDGLPDLNRKPFKGCYILDVVIFGDTEMYVWAVDFTDMQLTSYLHEFKGIVRYTEKGKHDIREYGNITILDHEFVYGGSRESTY